MPPDCGLADAISAKLRAVIKAITPLMTNARIAEGPLTANATPARASIPPPTMAPTPIPNAPKKPIVRAVDEDDGSVVKVNSMFENCLGRIDKPMALCYSR